MIWFFYINYKKEKILDSYKNIVKSMMVEYNYSNFKSIKSISNDRMLKVDEFFKNNDKYYKIDIRETSEYYMWKKEKWYSELGFVHIKVPYLIKNHKEILWNIKRPIVLVCIMWYRSKLIMSILLEKWYNVYYIERWFKWLLLYNTNNKIHRYDYCWRKEKIENIIIVWNFSENKNFTIPYMKMTDEDIIKIINIWLDNNILNKNKRLKISCNRDEALNCSVWRESIWLILENMWFRDICLDKKVIF